jgi:hypothetical protein
MREDRRLRVFENRMLRIIFGPKREELSREERKLQNEELNDLYSSPIFVRMIKSRRMGRNSRRWEDNIRMDLQEVGGKYGLGRAD